jgi:RNA polymerase sigma-70 factor (ECF subfamily)
VAAAKDDPEQFLVLYERYFPSVHRYMCLRARDQTSAEDLTSQVFLNALTKLRSFTGRGSFSAWLFRIAQNTIRDSHRRTKTVEPVDQALLVADPRPGPEEQTLAADRGQRLWAQIASLRPDHQHLLALRYGAGLDFNAIAALTDKKPTAARVAVHRALEELRQRYTHD